MNKRKQKKNKKSPVIDSYNNHTLIEINYDKLANAIVKANEKAQQQREEKEQREELETQKKWEDAIGLLSYNGNSKICKRLDQIRVTLNFITRLSNFKKEDIVGEKAIYAIFKMSNSFMIFIYKLIFAAFALIFAANPCIYYIITGIFPYYGIPSILFGFFLFLIFNIIRIAAIELENSKNKEIILSIFGAFVSFTSMIFAIIAIIIAT